MANNANLSLDERIQYVLDKLGNRQWQQSLRAYMIADDKQSARQLRFTLLFFFLSVIASLALAYYVKVNLGFWWAVLISFPLVALVSLFRTKLFVIQHDAGHQSLFSDKKRNKKTVRNLSLITWVSEHWSGVHAIHHLNNAVVKLSDIGDVVLKSSDEFKAMSWHQKLYYVLHRQPVFLCVVVGTFYVTVYERFRFDLLKEEVQNIKVRNIRQVLHSNAPHLNNLMLLLIYGGLFFIFEYFFGMGVLYLSMLFLSNVVWGTIAFWFFYLQHQEENLMKLTEANEKALNEKYELQPGDKHLLVSILGSTLYDIPKWLDFIFARINIHPIHHLSDAINNINLKPAWEAMKAQYPDVEKMITKISVKESFGLIHKWYLTYDEKTERLLTLWEVLRRYGWKVLFVRA